MQSGPELDDVAEALESLAVWLRRLAPNAMTVTAMTTLGTLQTEGPLRVSDLARSEAMTQPGMTTLLHRLEAQGLAERFADPTDGRATLVRITADGRELIASRRADRQRLVLTELDRLDDTQRAALAAALPAIDALVAPAFRTHPRNTSRSTSS